MERQAWLSEAEALLGEAQASFYCALGSAHPSTRVS